MSGKPSWRGPILALAAGAAAFFSAGFVRQLQTVRQVAVVVRPVAAGQPLTSADFRWQPVPSWQVPVRAYARQNLSIGEVLGPALVASEPGDPALQTVAVVPGAASDLEVAEPGGWVKILVVSPQGVVWQSSPVQVLAVSTSAQPVLGDLGRGAMTVAMPPAMALAYETARVKGTVELVGTGP